MVAPIKKTFLAVACSSLLISSQPVAAGNTPMTISGVCLAAVSGIIGVALGTAYSGYKALEKGSSDGQTLGEIFELYKNEPGCAQRRNDMANVIGTTVEELDTLTFSQYQSRTIKRNQAKFDQLCSYIKTGCAVASMGFLGGIAIAIKGYRQA